MGNPAHILVRPCPSRRSAAVILRSTKPPTSSQTSPATSSMRRRVASRHEFDVGPDVHCRARNRSSRGTRAPAQAFGCSPNYVIYQLNWVDGGYSLRSMNDASCAIPNPTSNSPPRRARIRFPPRFPQNWLLPRRSTRTHHPPFIALARDRWLPQKFDMVIESRGDPGDGNRAGGRSHVRRTADSAWRAD